MTIRVQGPDGVTIEFPAGTPDDVMSKAMAAHYGSTAKPASGQVADFNRLPPDQQKALDPASQRGLIDHMADGATFGFADKARAKMRSMITGMPYDDAIKEVRGETKRSADELGWKATAANLAGGVATGVGAAGAGLTAARFIPQGMSGAQRIMALMGAGAVDGAAMGALSGAGNTDDSNYATRMAEQGAIGAGVGAAAPAFVAGVAKVAEPVTNAVLAKFAPETFARRLSTRAIENSGKDVGSIRQAMQEATADGQGGVYTVADAMGPGGSRALNGVARGNSPEAMRVKEFLDARQTGAKGMPGQAERVEGFVREGLDAPTTGEQLMAKLEGIRKAKGNAAYPEAAKNAAPVDLSQTIANIDQGINPSGLVSTLNDNPIQAALRSARSQITNGKETLTDFDRVRQLFMATRDAGDEAFRAGAGAKGSALKSASDDMRAALEQSYPPFADAQRAQSHLFRAKEAVEKGREAGSRGLTQDVQDTFAKMTPTETGAARYGYADEVIKRIQRAREGNNTTGAMTSEKFVQDLPAVARPGRADKMQRQINRENEMNATRATVTGGSQTANNLADMMAAGGAYGAGSGLDALGLSGGYGQGAGGTMAAILMARKGVKALNNISPSDAARRELAKALLSSNADDIASMAAKQMKNRELSEQSIAAMARAIAASGIGASSSPR
jgi:hypothetical protein